MAPILHVGGRNIEFKQKCVVYCIVEAGRIYIGSHRLCTMRHASTISSCRRRSRWGGGGGALRPTSICRAILLHVCLLSVYRPKGGFASILPLSGLFFYKRKQGHKSAAVGATRSGSSGGTFGEGLPAAVNHRRSSCTRRPCPPQIGFKS